MISFDKLGFLIFLSQLVIQVTSKECSEYLAKEKCATFPGIFSSKNETTSVVCLDVQQNIEQCGTHLSFLKRCPKQSRDNYQAALVLAENLLNLVCNQSQKEAKTGLSECLNVTICLEGFTTTDVINCKEMKRCVWTQLKNCNERLKVLKLMKQICLEETKAKREAGFEGNQFPMYGQNDPFDPQQLNRKGKAREDEEGGEAEGGEEKEEGGEEKEEGGEEKEEGGEEKEGGEGGEEKEEGEGGEEKEEGEGGEEKEGGEGKEGDEAKKEGNDKDAEGKTEEKEPEEKVEEEEEEEKEEEDPDNEVEPEEEDNEDEEYGAEYEDYEEPEYEDEPEYKSNIGDYENGNEEGDYDDYPDEYYGDYREDATKVPGPPKGIMPGTGNQPENGGEKKDEVQSTQPTEKSSSAPTSAPTSALTTTAPPGRAGRIGANGLVGWLTVLLAVLMHFVHQ